MVIGFAVVALTSNKGLGALSRSTSHSEEAGDDLDVGALGKAEALGEREEEEDDADMGGTGDKLSSSASTTGVCFCSWSQVTASSSRLAICRSRGASLGNPPSISLISSRLPVHETPLPPVSFLLSETSGIPSWNELRAVLAREEESRSRLAVGLFILL